MNQNDYLIRIVDDEKEICSALQLLLLCDDRESVIYNSAEDFLERDNHMVKGCVLSDIRMGGMSGLELQEEMIKRKIGLPLIFITGHGDIEMAVDALKRGAVDFLVKPVKEAKLFEAIDRSQRLMSAGTGPAHLKEAIENLTDREFTILRMTCENVPTRVIAEAFGLSERTVQGHRHHIYQKLGLNSADKLIEAIPREWLKSRR